MNNRPKTTERLRAIFGLGKRIGFEKQDLEDIARSMTHGEVTRLSLLSFDQANDMIEQFGGDPLPKPSSIPIRTRNYHRQKAGVRQIATKTHLDKMYELAAVRMTETGLAAMGLRMLKHWPPRTTIETNKIIEALKSMNARDRRSANTPVREESA